MSDMAVCTLKGRMLTLCTLSIKKSLCCVVASLMGEIATQAESRFVTPSTQIVGNAFVEQYYLILHQSPQLVCRFYQNLSVLSRPDSNYVMASTMTLQECMPLLFYQGLVQLLSKKRNLQVEVGYKIRSSKSSRTSDNTNQSDQHLHNNFPRIIFRHQKNKSRAKK